MTTNRQAIEAIHAAYCECTGLDMRLTMAHLEGWSQWLAQDYTEEDLRDVVRYRKWLEKNGLPHKSLQFRGLIGYVGDSLTLACFEEDRAEAKKRRAHQPTERERVLAMTGRAEPEPPPRSAKEIIEQGFRELLALKETLK